MPLQPPDLEDGRVPHLANRSCPEVTGADHAAIVRGDGMQRTV